MQMSWKENWPDAERRWRAYWQGEIVDRPVILLSAPRADAPPLPPEPATLEEKWTDIDYQVRLSEAQNLGRHYLGEAVPVQQGPQMAWCAYFGGPVTYMPETIWMETFLDDWSRAPDWKRAWDDRGWRHLKKMVGALAEARQGRYWVGYPPTMHGAHNDMLAQMRGVNQFLVDLVESPDEVTHTLEAMRANHGRMYDEMWDLIHSYGYEGYGNWWPIWCPDRLGVWQSDISCMISPAMFEHFIVPELEDNCSLVHHACYHLDGPGAIKHVERVCDIPGIHTIQWVPGAGQKPGALQWMDLFKKVQAKGRSMLFGFEPHELETIIQELDPRKLLLGTGVGSVEEGERLLADAVRWTAKYWGKRIS
jgi:hypothetical protein